MKTCKKLFSLLLVAVMLVAAIPFAAMATPIGHDAKGPFDIYAKCNGVTIGQSRWEGDFASAFEPDTQAGAEYVLDSSKPSTTDYAYENSVLDESAKTLTVNYKIADTHNHTYDPATGKCTIPGCSGTDPNWVDPNPNPNPNPGTGSSTGGSSTTVEYKTVRIVYLDENGTVRSTTADIVLANAYAGDIDDAHAQAILTNAGSTEVVSNYASATVAKDTTNGIITVSLKDKPDTRYILSLTVVNGATTTTDTFRANFSGSATAENVLAKFEVGNKYNLNNYTYTNPVLNGKTFTMTITAKPTSADQYTVNCAINGNQYASKSNVTYTGSFDSNATNAQAILDAAKITVTASSYESISITKSSNGVISIDLRNTKSIKVYNNATTYTTVTMEVGRPYINYLGTNIINNSTFGGITVKDNSGASRFYTASQVTGGTAVVNANDVEVTIQRNGDSCTLNFLRSDGTVLESRKLYAGDQIGTLPSYTVGGVPATWTYNGKPISATDVYNFKTTSVNIVPYFGGISDVYVDVYINGNVKTMQTRVKVTDLVQNGVLYLNSDVKSAISSALRNSSNKNLTYTAFFDASTWSDFIKNKNTNGAAEPYRVGDNSERQGAVYLYVMVNNATVKATDSTNPKTGDNVKLGAAAAILAVAVVGFGAVVVINKKKGVR